MKTSIKIIALVIAAGFPVVALADFAGIAVPFNPSLFLGGFVTAFVGLLLVSDYSRRTRDLSLTRASVIVPAAGVFVTSRSDKSECLAA